MLPSHRNESHQRRVLRHVDLQLLQALGESRPMGIAELTSVLGVTATAVRQRIERLLAAGLIQRQKQTHGRGRPSYTYRLTQRGRWYAGADATELVEVMWQEIVNLPAGDVRSRLLNGIARRLAQQLAPQPPSDECSTGPRQHQRSPAVPAADDLAETMRRIGEELWQRSIVVRVDVISSPPAWLPVLDVPCCPYPALRDATDDRSLCELEQRVLSEALGRPVHLASCLLDGDRSCRFVPGVSTPD